MQLRAKCLQLTLGETLAQFEAFNLLSLTQYEVGISVGTDNHAQIQEQHVGESPVSQLDQSVQGSWTEGQRFFHPGRQ
jgi:hypothetical protein